MLYTMVTLQKGNLKEMDRSAFERVMNRIVENIENAGYNAYDQLKAYTLTGDVHYITREGNTRNYIEKLDREQIRRYLKYIK